MTTTVHNVVRAVLYEGYNLYPYRRSVKSQRRWMFGVLYPRAYSEACGGSDPCSMQTQCLIEAAGATEVDIEVQFLHLVERRVAQVGGDDPRDERNWTFVEALELNGSLYQSWQEATERTVPCGVLGLSMLAERPATTHFEFPAWREIEEVYDAEGRAAAIILHEQQAVEGCVECAAEHMAADQVRLTVRIENTTTGPANERLHRNDAPLCAFVSTHTILEARDGEFVSLIEPPAALCGEINRLSNQGTWPVLVGEEGRRDTMLSSPIILYDYPQIAAESPGELFDSTEIDEILALRVMTLTDDEKRQMRGVDERTRALLERTETLPAEQMAKLHGAIRSLQRVTQGDS